jgi:nucleotide-binding universal stress UspA family protein
VRKELKAARKALARGRVDESLVHLWNVIEPARLSGDRRALGEIAQLATEIRERGEPSEQREAERLLEDVRETAAEEGVPQPAVSVGGGANGGYVPEGKAAEEVEAERTQGGLGRFILPAIFLIIVIVNVIAGLTGED